MSMKPPYLNFSHTHNAYSLFLVPSKCIHFFKNETKKNVTPVLKTLSIIKDLSNLNEIFRICSLINSLLNRLFYYKILWKYV